MFSQLFGKYLMEKSVLTETDYKEAIKKQISVRVKLGTIAVAEGLLTEEQAGTIHDLQKQLDRRFGDIAVDKGLLNADQVISLLQKQGNSCMQFLQVLSESGKLTASQISSLLTSFQKENGFSDEEMEALKNNDTDTLIPVFAASAKPHVTELAALFIRNINRFVTGNFYFEKMRHVHSLKYTCLTGQKLIGDDTICLALAEEGQEALSKIATGFVGISPIENRADICDGVGEFINITSGLYASAASRKNISLDMEPAFAYLDQQAEGDFYILPICLEDCSANLIIAVNSEIKPGTTPFVFTGETAPVKRISQDSKGSILLVDDSRMSRKILRSLAEEAGYSVIGEAADGETALALYKQCRPDLVTLDITMPKMDGLEALKGLMEMDPSAKVIMITAAGQESKLIKALKVGAKRFVTKPFDKEELLTNIHDVMKGQ